MAQIGSVVVTVAPRTRRRLTLTVATLAVLSAISAVAPPGAGADSGVGSWTPTGSMPQPWAAGSAVALSNGHVLAVAGDTERTSTDLYDPSAGLWSAGPDVPVSAASSTLVALADGEALLVGGASCGSSGNIAEYKCLPTSSIYRLSSTGAVWSQAASMSEARAEPTAVRLADGRVLVVGGFGQGCSPAGPNGYSCAPLATAEIFDPASGHWSTTAPLPQARGGASATLLSDGTVLVVGGYEGQEAVRYDPGTGNWTAAGETATPRTGSLLFGLPGGRALALEGDEPYTGFFGSLGTGAMAMPPRCNPSSETFTATVNAWTTSLTEPAGSSNCPNGALLAGGQIVLGGVLNYSQSGPALTSPFLLDARQSCWSTTAPPIVPRSHGAVVALPDGRALVFGGYDANSPGNLPLLSSAEIYAPGSPTCGGQPVPPPGSPRFTGATILHVRHLTFTASSLIRLLEQCPKTATNRCVGHVQLSLAAPPARAKSKRRTRTLFLGESPFFAPAGKTEVVSVPVTKNKRALVALLRRKGHGAIIASTSSYEEAGHEATTTATAVIRVKRRMR